MESSFGNPAQTCWSCDQGGSSYDDDTYESYRNDAAYDDDDDKYGGKEASAAVAAPQTQQGQQQLQKATWFALDGVGAGAAFSQVKPQPYSPRATNPTAGRWHIAAWDEMKHAGWNEPANRYVGAPHGPLHDGGRSTGVAPGGAVPHEGACHRGSHIFSMLTFSILTFFLC